MSKQLINDFCELEERADKLIKDRETLRTAIRAVKAAAVPTQGGNFLLSREDYDDLCIALAKTGGE